MSKERLELIKSIHEDDEDVHQFDIDWFIEQAERVGKLKFALKVEQKHNKINNKLIDRLKKQNNRYRETIELVKDELKNAINPSKSKGVREVYVENCIRFLNEALESESDE